MNTFYQDTNWNEVEASGESKLAFPEGIVKVIISESDIKPGAGKTEDTHLVQHITLQVIEGEYKGAETKIYFSLKNPNEQAVTIAKGQMKSMFLAIGAYPKAGLNEVHKKPFKVKIEHEIRNFTDNRTGQARQAINNVIKGYYSVNTSVPGEEIPLKSAKQSLIDLGGNGVQSVAPASPVAGIPPRLPPSPPVAPKAPPVPPSVTTTEADISNEPAWLTE
jgi:hypothetical protein